MSTIPPLVLVHIGDTIPTYIEHCVNQAIVFGNTHIYLIISKNTGGLSPSVESAFPKVNIIYYEDLPLSPSHLFFKRIQFLPPGFWTYTTERLFYLESFMKSKNIENVFHIENDVLLYYNLEKLIPIFNNLIDDSVKNIQSHSLISTRKNSLFITPIGEDYASCAFMFIHLKFIDFTKFTKEVFLVF